MADLERQNRNGNLAVAPGFPPLAAALAFGEDLMLLYSTRRIKKSLSPYRPRRLRRQLALVETDTYFLMKRKTNIDQKTKALLICRPEHETIQVDGIREGV